jgi:Ribbon-helix-helix protein, copG family.
MKKDNMKQKLNITLHKEEIKLLEELCKIRSYSKSSMIGILIREYEIKMKIDLYSDKRLKK